MLREEYDDAVAAFIRTRGITRCPTACVLPTQASIAATDRSALEDHAAERERLHERRMAAWRRSFRIYRVPASTGE
jgi:hypothetical protein